MDILIIRSSDREEKDSTFSHDCRIKLRTALTPCRYQLVSACLPQTAQVLRPFDNTVLHFRHGENFIYTTTLALPAGYYSAETLVTELQSHMNQRRAQEQPVENYTWTVVHSSISGRIGIHSAGSPIEVTDGQYSMHETLGVTPGQQTAAIIFNFNKSRLFE